MKDEFARQSFESMPLAEIVKGLGFPPDVQPMFVGVGQNNRVYDVGGEILRIPLHAEAERALEREARVLAALGPLLSTDVPRLKLRRIGTRCSRFIVDFRDKH
ncbi:MAG TPA: hypothetical protein VGO04_26295 [Ensifer sp.]|uniref:hypothetical protein n=1 Tax=Ensifer sp. TaxID=1872086 RepID=UPI002E127C58|nr:hypothetical protein [Ensifer sp.]